MEDNKPKHEMVTNNIRRLSIYSPQLLFIAGGGIKW